MIEILHSKLTKGQENYVLRGNEARLERRYLGSGATAVVVAYGRERVIRTQRTSYDHDASLYLSWAQLCLKSRSKHVPKIDFLAVVRNDRDDCIAKVITVMERLEESDTADIEEDDVYTVERLLDGRRADWKQMTPEARKRFPKTAALALKKRIDAAGLYCNDLHPGNWMVRKSDGRLVITDPIA